MKSIKLLEDKVVYLGTAMPIRCLIKKGTPLIEASNLPPDAKIGWWVADDADNTLILKENGGTWMGYDWQRVKSYQRNNGIPIYYPASVFEQDDERDNIVCEDE